MGGSNGTTDVRAPRTRICLALTEPTISANLRLVEAQRRFIDLVELRADFLLPSEYTQLRTFAHRAGLPAILTVRRERDGGRYVGAESDRFALIRQGLAGKWDYLDLEEDVSPGEIESEARARGVRIIRSLHAKEGLPAQLVDRVRRLARAPDELPKAAVLLRSTRDFLAFLDAARALRGFEKILIGMGPFGFASRILAGPLGSTLTYCSAGEQIAAPGHADPRTLAELYRVRTIGSETALYAIIGNPVMHSRSPEIHNLGFAALGIDAVYLPLQVDDVALFFEVAERLGVRGSSVTIPHKTAVLPYLSERDRAVERIGSCNTLLRTPGGWRGTNTDAAGFRTSLDRATAKLSAPRGEGSRGGDDAVRALVVGAGGAARAIVWALVEAGWEVTVLNRTVERARILAAELGCGWGELSRQGLELARPRAGRGFDAIVQTTSVGMHPNEGEDPLAFYEFQGTEIAYELIYAPPRTRFLERAANAGCTTIGGFDMLLEQAYLQFELFTGRPFPRSDVRIPPP